MMKRKEKIAKSFAMPVATNGKALEHLTDVLPTRNQIDECRSLPKSLTINKVQKASRSFLEVLITIE